VETLSRQATVPVLPQQVPDKDPDDNAVASLEEPGDKTVSYDTHEYTGTLRI